MNTPSKEALDAAENVQDYWGFPRRATIDLATIIDRHFEPLRAEMVQLTVDRDNWKIRAEEMDGYKADCMELRQRAKQAEASNSELRESHAAIYLALATLEADCSKWPDQIRALRAANADLTQSNAELAEAMRDKLLRIANNETARVDKAEARMDELEAERDSAQRSLRDYQADFRKVCGANQQALTKAEARVKELEAACAELVTDGNAITLAANLAKQSKRVKELEFGLKHQCETCEMKSIFDGEHAYALKMQARVKELEAQK